MFRRNRRRSMETARLPLKLGFVDEAAGNGPIAVESFGNGAAVLVVGFVAVLVVGFVDEAAGDGAIAVEVVHAAKHVSLVLSLPYFRCSASGRLTMPAPWKHRSNRSAIRRPRTQSGFPRT